MTSIIQSNRERKSRLDKGLVERLNQKPDKDVPEQTTQSVQNTSNLRFITDKQEYDDIVRYMNCDFPDYKSILTDNLKYDDGVMKGSNVYIALAIKKYLRGIDSDYRIATLKQLENNFAFVKGYFVDIGIAIRSFEGYKPIDDIQDKSVNSLFSNVKHEGILQADLPVAINLSELHLLPDMKMTAFSKIDYHRSESINWRDEMQFSETDDFGLPTVPVMVEKPGFRRIYTSKDKVARCMLSENSNIFTSYFNFSSSSKNYRIVLAKK